jgi:hypothetical protein
VEELSRKVRYVVNYLQARQSVAKSADGKVGKRGGDRAEAGKSPSGDTFHINGPVGAVMSGSGNVAVVSQSLTQNNLLKQHLADLEKGARVLPDKQRDEALEYIEAIRSEADSGRPKKALVKTCGEALNGLLTPEMMPLVATVLSIIDQNFK